MSLQHERFRIINNPGVACKREPDHFLNTSGTSHLAFNFQGASTAADTSTAANLIVYENAQKGLPYGASLYSLAYKTRPILDELVVVGPMQVRSAGNLSEPKSGQTRLVHQSQ